MIGALIENIQREDLNAIEIAEGIELLMKKFNLTQEQTSEKLGMNRVTLTNYLRLLKLPEAVKQGIISGDITQGHARPLLGLDNRDDMLDVFSKVLKKKLSVRQAESLVKDFYKKGSKDREYDPDIKKTEEKLTRLFSTKVKLNYSQAGKGKIEIYFSGVDEFDRIYKMIFKE
jgi:ParB family chromosome partitioning protein